MKAERTTWGHDGIAVNAGAFRANWKRDRFPTVNYWAIFDFNADNRRFRADSVGGIGFAIDPAIHRQLANRADQISIDDAKVGF